MKKAIENEVFYLVEQGVPINTAIDFINTFHFGDMALTMENDCLFGLFNDENNRRVENYGNK